MTADGEPSLDDLTAAIEAAPGDIRPRLARAAFHAKLGRTEEARADYLAALAIDPASFTALNDLGVLLHRTDYRSAARLAYAEAVRRHPDNPVGRINLGNALLEDGQVEAARAEFEAALRLAPDHPDAHQGMANLLQQAGEHESAERHRQASYAGRAITRLPYRGPGEPRRVLLLVSAAGGNLSTRFILDERRFQVDVMVAEAFTGAAPLPPHDVVFNAIGDADLARAGLQAAERIRAATRAPFVNPPQRVMATGRQDMARRLGALEDVIAPRMEQAARDGLAEAAARLGFPLLLRSPGYHTGQHFLRVETPAECEAAAAQLPGRDLLLIQPLTAPDAEGWFRKYRVMAIGGRLYPAHLAFSRHWKVHYFTADMQDRPGHRAQEAAFLQDPRAALGSRAMAALERIAAGLALDYAGVDFDLAPDGRVLLFEANAAMSISPPGAEPLWDYRREAIGRVLAAAVDLAIAPGSSTGSGE